MIRGYNNQDINRKIGWSEEDNDFVQGSKKKHEIPALNPQDLNLN